MKHYRNMMSVVLLGLISLFLSACLVGSDSDKARTVAEQFWTAIINQDMEQAKTLASWDSANYLQYIHSLNMSPKRFELGELRVEGNAAEVATVLFSSEQSGVRIPARTVLVRYKDEWRVDVQKTLGSMASGAMGTVVQELNNFLQEGVNQLNQGLNQNLNELGESLKQGMDQLQQDLQNQPLQPGQPVQPEPPRKQQQI